MYSLTLVPCILCTKKFTASSISFLSVNYIAIFPLPYIVYLHSKCLQKFINLTSGIFMLNTYKHLHSLTFASCLLNNQQQAPKLICINTIPSVSYCSKVMLYLTFKLRYLNSVFRAHGTKYFCGSPLNRCACLQ